MPENMLSGDESYFEFRRVEKGLQILRMEGGAAAVKEIPKDDDEDELEKLQKGPRLKKEPRGSIELNKGKSKTRLAFHYIKLSILFIICIAFTVFLMLRPENKSNMKMTTVLPNETRYFSFALDEVWTSKLMVTFEGPFTVRDFQDDKANAVEMIVEKFELEKMRKFKEKTKEATEPFYLPINGNTKEELKKVNHLKKAKTFEFHGTDYFEKNSLELRLKMTNPKAVEINLKLWYTPTPIDQFAGIIIGAFVLVFLYGMIVSEIVDRTLASVITSTLAVGFMSLLGDHPSLDTVLTWIDVETIVLLFGMMILVAVLSDSGIFDYLAVFAFKITKGRIRPLLNCLFFFTAILSGFLDNVTMMLLIAPVIIRLCEVTSLNPVPIMMCLVIYSNVGAALTPVGDPPNLIITTNRYIAERDVNFGNFTLHMLPGVVLGLLTTWVHLQLLFKIDDLRLKTSGEEESKRKEVAAWSKAAAGVNPSSNNEDEVLDTLKKKIEEVKNKETKSKNEPPPDFKETLERLTKEYPIRDKVLLIKSTVAFGFVLILFFLHAVPNIPHLSLGWVALLGALFLLVIADVNDMESVLARIEWNTLTFFASLFILMEALTQLGFIGLIGEGVVKLISIVPKNGQLAVTIVIILWVTAIASAFLDNIPVTTMMVRIVIQLAENEDLNLPLHPLVWTLAFGACFGGNGTIIGASANVVSAGVIQQHGFKFGFVEFLRVGFQVMVTTVLVINGYLLFAHVLFTWHDR